MGLSIQTAFNLANDPSFLLKRVFVQACKSIPSELLPAALAHRGLGSTDYPWNLQARLQAAESYAPERDEKEQLDRLILHRKVLYLYALKVRRCIDLPYLSDGLAAELATHIDRLEQPSAPDVLTDCQGRRYFCMPGGNKNHMVVYEFARETDGSYTFMLYDKFATESDLHGNIRFMHEGRMVGRTRVQFLALSKRDLQNRDFLKLLIEVQRYDCEISMQDIRASLRHFLKTSFQTAFRHPKDPDFHSEALGDCCTESNAQTPEHFLVDKNLRKKLKRHALAEAVKQAGALLDKEPELKRLALEKLT